MGQDGAALHGMPAGRRDRIVRGGNHHAIHPADARGERYRASIDTIASPVAGLLTQAKVNAETMPLRVMRREKQEPFFAQR
jgi:hypothetical protein